MGILNDVVDFFEGATGKLIDAIDQVFDDVDYEMDKAIIQMSDLLEQAYDETVGEVMPDDVNRFMSLMFLVMDTALTSGNVQLAKDLVQAIKDGRFPYWTDLIAGEVAKMLMSAEQDARRVSLPLPNVVQMMPRDAGQRRILEMARFTTLDRLDSKAFFAIWDYFKGNETAITLNKHIIFVDKAPDFTNYNTLFLAMHECAHVYQYDVMGVDDFIRDYLYQRAKKGRNTTYEIEADYYACSLLPNGSPAYIGACPLPP